MSCLLLQDSEHEPTSCQDVESKPHVRTATDTADIAGVSSRLTGHTHSDTTHTQTHTTEAGVEHSQQNVTGHTKACAKSGLINTDQIHTNGQNEPGAKPGPSKVHQTRANGQIRTDAMPGPSMMHETRVNGQIRDDAKPGPSKAHQTRANGQIRTDATPGPNKTDRICVSEQNDVKPRPSKTNRTRVNGQLRADTESPVPGGVTDTESPVPGGVNLELDDLNDDRCATSRVGEVEKPVTRQRGKAKRKYVSYDSDSLEDDDSQTECVPPKLAKKKTPASKVDLGIKWQNTRVGKNKTKANRKAQQAELVLVDRWKSKFPH